MTKHSDPHGVTAIYGGPGVGKTTLIIGALIAYGRLGATLSLDITGDIERALRKRLPKGQTIVKITSIDDYKKITQSSFLTGQFRGFVRGNHVVVGVPPISKQTATSAEESAALWIALASAGAYRSQFVAAFCDEAEQVFPGTGRVDAGFGFAARIARNERRSIVLAVKRPTALATTVRSVVRRLCVFRVSSDADVKACSELGPARLFERVQYLEKGAYLYYAADEHTPADELPELSSLDAPPWV